MRKLLALLLLPLAAGAADVTVNWTQPVANTDGSSIPATGAGSIASNRVEWGTCSGSAFGVKAGDRTVPAATSAVVANLAPGTHCFRAYATNTYGNESAASVAASRVIVAPTPNPPVITTVAVAAMLYRNGVQYRVGTVELGTACGALVVDRRKRADWYTVNRDDVRLNKRGRDLGKSAVIVAKCA
jgi:hypothetical protein